MISINDKFGKLTAIKSDGPYNGKRTMWFCKCECGKTISVSEYKLRVENIVSCGCDDDFQEYKKLVDKYWKEREEQANECGLPFEITLEYMWDLFKQQKGRCALTNSHILLMISNSKGELGLCSARMNRINTSLGDIPGNMRWVNGEQVY